MPRLRALLIDLSGTLHVGDTPTPNASAALKHLRESGIVLRFVSNTSKESTLNIVSTGSSLLQKMRKMDLDVREDELFTSLSAVRDLVLKRDLRYSSPALFKTPLYLLTPSALSDFPAPSPPYNSVVVGLSPDSFAYSKLNEAFRLLAGEEGEGRRGEVPLVATHKAKYFGDKDGKLSLGPGPFISTLEEAASCQAEIVGKPSPAFFELALASFASHGFSKSEVGMIGDDVLQDVGPAVARLGLRRFLVQTGKYRRGDEDRLLNAAKEEERAAPPDWVGESFAKAVESILAE
ncbi:SPOSA6832_01000, partial [Sporobolomyces salmonicolor]